MQRRESQFDYILLLVIGCLFIFSLIAVYSGSGQYAQDDPFYFVKRQIIWYIVGIGIMFIVAYFDYELLERIAIYFYGIGIGLLLMVHFFGTSKNGSQRWLDLVVFDLQPSEFVKIFVILFLSVVLSKIGEERISFIASIPVTLKVITYSGIPFGLIMLQPDLGSALMVAAIAISLILISSVSIKMIGLIVGGLASIMMLLVYLYQYQFEIFTKIFKPHQMGRIYGWLNPNEFASDYGYQLKQAMLGIGSGQLSGSGFNQGAQVQSGKIPEAHTDFIFAVIGEEFGFIGASILITLYFILIYRIIAIALRSNSLFGVYICIGTVGLFAFQIFQNIAMTIGIMPITGLPLPLVSYGGSALTTNMIALGLVLSVQIRSKDYMFSDNS